jgi:hypothetical protein
MGADVNGWLDAGQLIEMLVEQAKNPCIPR